MKKYLLFLAILTLLLAVAVLPASAADKIIGEALYTDIVAYIDGHPIESYNVRGNTYIKVEDLTDYGFRLFWDAESAELYIYSDRTESPDFYTTTYYVKPVGPALLSTKRADIYETKIKTIYWDNGKETPIDACNIGGMTLIWFDDLARLTDSKLEWVPKEKALRMTTALAAFKGGWGISNGTLNCITWGVFRNGGEGVPYESARYRIEIDGYYDHIYLQRPSDPTWRTYSRSTGFAFTLSEGDIPEIIPFDQVVGLAYSYDSGSYIRLMRRGENDSTEFFSLDSYLKQHDTLVIVLCEVTSGSGFTPGPNSPLYVFNLYRSDYLAALELYNTLNP